MLVEKLEILSTLVGVKKKIEEIYCSMEFFSGIHTFNHENINDIITQKFEKVEPGMYTSKKQYGLSEQCRQSFI